MVALLKQNTEFAFENVQILQYIFHVKKLVMCKKLAHPIEVHGSLYQGIIIQKNV